MIKTILISVIFCLFAFQASAESIHFQWGQSTGVVDGYRIYYNSDNSNTYSELLIQVDGDTRECTVILDDTKNYYLICKAFNTFGESGSSNKLSFIRNAVPSPVTDFIIIDMN